MFNTSKGRGLTSTAFMKPDEAGRLTNSTPLMPSST